MTSLDTFHFFLAVLLRAWTPPSFLIIIVVNVSKSLLSTNIFHPIRHLGSSGAGSANSTIGFFTHLLLLECSCSFIASSSLFFVGVAGGRWMKMCGYDENPGDGLCYNMVL
eukprot:scaffold12318_cov151-Amphora_coffeaeformis.AAC.6